jgi:integrase/recombinase XerD
MVLPKPILEFYTQEDRLSGSDDVQSQAFPVTAPTPSDVRWAQAQEFLRANTFRPNTVLAYERELRKFLAWTDTPWADISSRDFANYKHDLEQQGLAISSVARALAPVKSIFKWLAASGYIHQNPTLNTKLPTPPEPLPQHFTDAEVDALYEALDFRGTLETRDRAILTAFEFAGLRISEVSALNLEDFVAENDDLAYPGWGYIIVREAKDDSVGRVPLPPEAIAAIQAYLEERQASGDLIDQPNTPLFLAQSLNPQRRGTRLGEDGIYDLFQDLQQITGIANCHPHRLRHTFGTRLVLMGMDSYLGRKLMRQKSERAYRRYTEYARQLAAEQAYKQTYQRRR